MTNSTLFQPSGLNSRCLGSDELAFSDYIAKMRDIITQSRIDLNSEHREFIVDANCPYDWQPTTPNGKGVLLIHGLFSSPFPPRDIGQHLLKRGFRVKSILLPGHGTRPGDLLTIRYQEWVHAVTYALHCLRQEADEIYIMGCSMGAMLAIQQALLDKTIRGLILMAPALKARSRYTFMVNWHKLISWKVEDAKWYQQHRQKSVVKYESFAFNAADQATQLLKSLGDFPAFDTPVFIANSADDETVDPDAILEFFQHNPDSRSRLVYYSNGSKPTADPRVILRPSAFPEHKILNFSHTCMQISPDNPVFGPEGSYRDFQHYPNNLPPPKSKIFYGAITRANLKKHVMQRLCYNPDFPFVLEQLDAFLDRLGN